MSDETRCHAGWHLRVDLRQKAHHAIRAHDLQSDFVDEVSRERRTARIPAVPLLKGLEDALVGSERRHERRSGGTYFRQGEHLKNVLRARVQGTPAGTRDAAFVDIVGKAVRAGYVELRGQDKPAAPELPRAVPCYREATWVSQPWSVSAPRGTPKQARNG